MIYAPYRDCGASLFLFQNDSMCYMFKIYTYILAITCFVLCVPIGTAFAHSIGQSLEQKTDAYVVDIGYDAIETITIEEPVRFSFDLWDSKETNHLPFSTVWVQLIGPDKRVAFAGTLSQPQIGFASMTYHFPTTGTYTLTARYADEKETEIASSTFPLTVEQGQSGGIFGKAGSASEAIAGIIIGAAITFFLMRRKS